MQKNLKPAIPIKFPTPERPQKNNKNKSDVANVFLPRELAEIVETSQRRERAWHARIMICTTVYSEIESALANFSDEIEKEEVNAFKAYLRQAISYFAAVDNSPTPPKISSHSKPTESNSLGSRKGKNIEKNVAVATPQLPKPPQTSPNTWVTVARNGQKKARVTQNNIIHTTSMSKIRPRGANVEKAPATPTDKRLFLRLPQEHEWRELSPAGIREVIVKKLSISLALVGKTKSVHPEPLQHRSSGKYFKRRKWALFDRSKIRSGHQLGVITNNNSSSVFFKEQGVVEVSNSMLADEVERVCSVRLAHIKLYGRNKPEAPHRKCMAFFPKAPRGTFKVFDESGIASLLSVIRRTAQSDF
ncbi:putative eka-like protein [Erysiphe necator]|uniref:Putative eka-like protein n=1 Tax=Uncinula necator TaxID=52586 RepID=A0A0B1PHX3_UNCNE|nr:putative eka-like protein [Erysiphe necator]